MAQAKLWITSSWQLNRVLSFVHLLSWRPSNGAERNSKSKENGDFTGIRKHGQTLSLGRSWW
jgi:hypothetical protein